MGTLWCKSMVASERCQGAILTILKELIFNGLRGFSRFRPAFVPVSSGRVPQTFSHPKPPPEMIKRPPE